MNTDTENHEKILENYVISSWEDENLNLHTSLLEAFMLLDLKSLVLFNAKHYDQ